jgi:hypothetical protein
LPSEYAQFASSAVSGAAPGAAAGLVAAATGLIRTDAPKDENRKRRVRVIDLMDVLLNVFFISFVITFVRFFVITFFMYGRSR